MKVLVISTDEGYVAGVATSTEAALDRLRQYWESASKEHPSNPNYQNWHLVPQKYGLPDIHATNPLDGSDRGWSIEEYEVWGYSA